MPRNQSTAVVVCAIIKDEPDVLEWIAYHRLIGVDHFFLYDNGSKRPLRNVLSRCAPFVSVTQWRGSQLAAYAHFVRTRRNSGTWAAFIDGDEYIVLKRHDSLQRFLSDYSAFSAVGLNWLMFDSNGHVGDKRPAGLVTELYTRRASQPSKTMKHVVKLSAVRTMYVHHARLTRGRQTDVLKRPTRAHSNPRATQRRNGVHLRDVACIHHYHTRSLADWRARLRRGQPGTGTVRTMTTFWARQSKKHPQDTWMIDHNWPARIRAFIAALPTATSAKPLAARRAQSEQRPSKNNNKKGQKQQQQQQRQRQRGTPAAAARRGVSTERRRTVHSTARVGGRLRAALKRRRMRARRK